ncbi:FAD-dependent monooxygenase [Micromonospora sp. NPDC049204]|uniref:FAD-dependent oxidoreductase n=1 Tax=unclassified Micromonospora TaxID=2617518 RepID=UPI0033F2D4A1
MLTSKRPILIIGGGIGGAAAALALRQAGLDAVVYEARSQRGTRYGGCYVLWYAGMQSLRRLGVADKVRAAGHRVDRFEMCDERGRLLYRVDMDSRSVEPGLRPLAIRRADVVDILHAELGSEALQLNSTLREFRETAAGVDAIFTNGRVETGQVLIGADGLHSRVRAHLHGLSPARHPGYAHWSGIAETDCGAPQHVFRIMHGNAARFAFFHLGDGRVNWWCTRNAPAGSDGDHLGELRALETAYRGWHPIVGDLLAATAPESVHRRDTVDRPPLRRWGRGRITLLGDAAHAMTFDLGQGAGTSLTDGVTLAHHLSRRGAPIAALRDYERARRAVTVPLALASRRIGEATGWRGPFGPQMNHLILRTIGARITPTLLALDARSHSALDMELSHAVR